MEPRFPYIGNDEDPLVARARRRASQMDNRSPQISAERVSYIVGAIALVVFGVFFVGGISWCLQILCTGMETGGWFLGI